jgi:hypothetical protein
MKVAASVYTSNFIPGNDVTNSLGNLQVAVWANPGLTVIGIRADACLGCVFNPALDFGTPKTQTNRVQV